MRDLYNFNVSHWNLTSLLLRDIRGCVLCLLRTICEVSAESAVKSDGSSGIRGTDDISGDNTGISTSMDTGISTGEIKHIVKEMMKKYSFSIIMDKSLLNKNSLYIYNTINRSLDLGIKCLIECNSV